MRIDNDIHGTVPTILLLVSWSGLLAWYNTRLNHWKRARKIDDPSEEYRKHVASLKSEATRVFAWAVGGMVATWLVLDLIF